MINHQVKKQADGILLKAHGNLLERIGVAVTAKANEKASHREMGRFVVELLQALRDGGAKI
jgi:hypothetical protein